MSYVIKAVLSNPQHPECGQITIPFPIPTDQYDQTINMLQAMDLGYSVDRDCKVDEMDSHYHVLNALNGTLVNVDQLDYLAKRLDSFCAGETDQFQAMASKLELTDIKDLINLTFCCQQATVITDFSDLEAVGRSHFMNLNGGSARTEELEDLDGVETALLLIDGGGETVTPYGVVYDNGMKLEQVYNGRQFPAYLYDNSPMALEVTPRHGLQDGEHPEYLYLPASERQIERTLLRAGVQDRDDLQLRLECHELPDQVASAASVDHLEKASLTEWNRMCRAIKPLDPPARERLEAAVMTAMPHGPDEVRRLAEGLRQLPVRENAPLQEKAPEMIALTLTTADWWYYLTLPASEEKMEDAKRDLEVEDLTQAMIAGVKYTTPDLERLIPTDSLTVENANALALCLQEMEQEDGGLTKFLAVLTVEQPDTFAEALNIAMDRNDYELVPEDAEEYGKQVLRRIGADDEIIDTIDGYMDFAQLGTDSLAEDGVRRTGFGLVRRLSLPFPPGPEIGQTMM